MRTEKLPNENYESNEETKTQRQLSAGRKSRKAGRGRLYIPHGRGKEKEYKPHAEHIDVSYTQCGPDWSSRLRWLPSPKPKCGEPKETTFHPPMKSIKHFPHRHNISTKKEYTFYPPHGIPLVFGKGKQTIFDNLHKASRLSSAEITDSVLFGTHANVDDPRNGISESSAGDKPYQAVEYSIDFHRLGSTRPVVDFGGAMKLNPPSTTNVQEPVPAKQCKPYTVKEREQRKQDEVESVKQLNQWRPASPLLVPITDAKA